MWDNSSSSAHQTQQVSAAASPSHHDHSQMAHGGAHSDAGCCGGGHGGHGGGRTMWMWYHFDFNDTILFEFWHVNSAWAMFASCVLLFLGAFVFEWVKWVRVCVDRRAERAPAGTTLSTKYGSVQNLTLDIGGGSAAARTGGGGQPAVVKRSTVHMVQTMLFAVQIVLSYLLMLAIMSFSVWVTLAICAGSAFGFYLFGSRPLPPLSDGNQLAVAQTAALSEPVH